MGVKVNTLFTIFAVATFATACGDLLTASAGKNGVPMTATLDDKALSNIKIIVPASSQSRFAETLASFAETRGFSQESRTLSNNINNDGRLYISFINGAERITIYNPFDVTEFTVTVATTDSSTRASNLVEHLSEAVMTALRSSGFREAPSE
jgi:hypothetical protein